MKNLKLIAALFVMGASLSTAPMQAQEKLPYLDTTLSFRERAADLVSRMTLEEKASQMVTDAVAIPRLGVPAYRWWNECLHGVARNGNATVFPQPIGMAATFDPILINQVAEAISDEGRILYNQAQARGNMSQYTGLTYFSPSINIYRDPRWGRGQETYGEDPYLTSEMGVAYVKGLQGKDEKYLKVAACAKHYVAYSGYTDGKVFNSEITDLDLYQTYLPAFKCLVEDAKVESVMGAYNQINGESPCASKKLMIDILRTDWGFTGWTTSDCGALWRLIKVYNLGKNAQEIAALALNSGLNLNCGGLYNKGIVPAVKKGLVDEKVVDELLTTLMLTRFKMGLFDEKEDVPYAQIPDSKLDCQVHRDLAYETASKSFVLMENKDNLLPFKNDINYVYITGCNAYSPEAMIGNYFGVNSEISTFVEGLADRNPEGVSIQFRPGVLLTQEAANPWTVQEAPEADVIVACLGLTNQLEGEGMDAIAVDRHGEMFDVAIPEAQLNFLKQLRENADKKGKKIVTVLTGGCPVMLSEIRELSDALIYAWYPGEEGGNALADILYGRVSPSGRTPLTFVKSLDQLPEYNDYSMKGRTYRFMDKEPLYPFGYGLSYTTFDFSDLQMTKSIKAGETVEVSVKVQNTGKMKSDEVVQMYITDDETNEVVPVRQLCGMKRISLAPGESRTVTLFIEPSMMSVITKKLVRKIEKGTFTVSVGNGQPVPQTQSYLQGQFTVENTKKIKL